ncbi:multicomponent Na+:H+ antiporter subunit C [Halorubrum aquaticum]|uniref:Multicomponent Na+:H+ antiporter subunit C n=1 Tax=Halorubrum aquaticum TaxID=387340 RepID=A0A1I3BE15_9EURY|nr:cation:proton antiporter subunit C [Halorubrum aquaticum]SFH59941.1 multicomponent Na+:H+ antiporter subunit C [Halorubrum aquaticum]
MTALPAGSAAHAAFDVLAGSPVAAGTALDVLGTRHAYVTFALLLCIGLYMMIANPNLVKKVIGLNLFQTAIFLLFIASAYVEGGAIPIVYSGGEGPYVSPLPHVIVLTAIVVGVSLTAVALALCIRIYDEYGTLRVDTLRELLREEGSLPAGPGLPGGESSGEGGDGDD